MKKTVPSVDVLEGRNLLSGLQSLSYFIGNWSGRNSTGETERLSYQRDQGHVTLTERFPSAPEEVAVISSDPSTGAIQEQKAYAGGARYDATWNHVRPRRWHLVGTYTSEHGDKTPMDLTLQILGPNRYSLVREVAGTVVERGIRIRITC